MRAGSGEIFFAFRPSKVYFLVKIQQLHGRSTRPWKGIHFLVDEHGKAKSVLIDLEEWGELWEDIYDGMIIEARQDEPTVPMGSTEGGNGAEIERQRVGQLCPTRLATRCMVELIGIEPTTSGLQSPRSPS